MQSYTEAGEYTNVELEAGLMAAIRAAPDSYWQALDLLPTEAADAFTIHGVDWLYLAAAIETNSILPGVSTLTAPVPDPLAAARTRSRNSSREENRSSSDSLGSPEASLSLRVTGKGRVHPANPPDIPMYSSGLPISGCLRFQPV